MSSSAKDTSTIPADVSRRQMEHDVRGGLAIAKGFIGALETSYSELKTTVSEIVEPIEQSVPQHQLSELQRLELDCNFCLARLIQSVDQIVERLNDAHASGSEHDQIDRDVA